ncbi:MAG TPA: hypothetical protein VG294_05835 [Solirubrobacteraceae bacterium]|jgi:hypothetical protein|nr:hypothetical protein [Solirubrobacteraceae bacterium]
MTRRPLVLVLCALASVAVAGCGGSGSAASRSPTAAATGTPTTPTVSLAVKLRQAVLACRKQVAKSPYILASERATAQADCEGIKSGHIAPLRALLLKACERTAAKLPVANQPAATEACKKVY